jgi:hypothetical protein
MADRPSAKIAGHIHAEILKLCDDYGMTVAAFCDAMLEYATAKVPRINEAIAEYHAKAARAASDRRKVNPPPHGSDSN